MDSIISKRAFVVGAVDMAEVENPTEFVWTSIPVTATVVTMVIGARNSAGAIGVVIAGANQCRIGIAGLVMINRNTISVIIIIHMAVIDLLFCERISIFTF